MLLKKKKSLYLGEQTDLQNLRDAIHLENEKFYETEKVINECKSKINDLNRSHIELTQQINEHLSNMRKIQNCIENLENVAEKKIMVKLL